MAIYNPTFGNSEKINSGVALNSGSIPFGNPSVVQPVSNKRRTQEFPFGSTLVNGINITGSSQNFLVPVPLDGVRSLIKRSTKTVGGLTNNVLLTSGCIQPELRTSIHYINSYRTRLEHQAYIQGKLNPYTGKFAAGYPDNEIDYFGYDTVGNLSRSNQGRSYYKYSKIVTITNYPAKTG